MAFGVHGRLRRARAKAPAVFDFTRNDKLLHHAITFARADAATCATRLQSFGLVRPRVNLLTYSEQFDNAAWGKADTTVTANQLVAPDGTVTMDLLTEGSAGTAIVTAPVVTVVAGTITTGSKYMVRGNTDWVRLRLAGSGSNAINGWFNLATGVKGVVSAAGAASAPTSTIEDVGSGIYRCSVSGVMSTDTAITQTTLSAAGDNDFARVNGSTRYMWGAQVELGSVATDYQRIAAATDYDTGYRRRTNLLTYTSSFVIGGSAWFTTTGGTGSLPILTRNYGTAPDGLNTALRIQFALNGGVTTADQSTFAHNVTTVVGSPYIMSVWLKTNDGSTKVVQLSFFGADALDVTVTPTWQRFSATTASASDNARGFRIDLRGAQGTSDSADILFWHPQHEKGSVATDYQWVEKPTDYAYDRTPVDSQVALVAAGVPRIDYDGPGAKGLRVAASHTNVVPNSRTSFNTLGYNPSGVVVTANYNFSPDGTKNATRVQSPAGQATHNYVAAPNGVSGQWHSFSCWIKPISIGVASFVIYAGKSTSTGGAQFNLTVTANRVTAIGVASGTGYGVVQNYGDWQRITLVFQATLDITDGNLTFAIGGGGTPACEFYLWQRQQVTGVRGVVDDIFTDGTAKTRATESAIINNLADINWNANGWTGYVEFEQGALGRVDDFGRVIDLHDGSFNNSIYLFQNNGTTGLSIAVRAGGVALGTVALGAVAAGGVAKAAFVLTPTGVVASLNGAAPVFLAVAVPMAVVNKANLAGMVGNAANSYLDGSLRMVKGYPYVATNEELQLLTA